MSEGGHRVTLFTREGCHLCDTARDVVATVAGQTGTPWEEIDVDGDQELREEYGGTVPVVLVDGVEFAFVEVDAAELRAALAN